MGRVLQATDSYLDSILRTIGSCYFRILDESLDWTRER